MKDMETIGLVASAIIAIGGLFAFFSRLAQPLNALRIEIQRLNDNLETLKVSNKNHDERISKLSEVIDKLLCRVVELETKMDMYHKGQK